MHRIYGWLKIIWQEKINIFIKGALGGGIVSGIFLFGSTIGDKGVLLLEYTLKLLAATVSGLITGCASVLGNDLAQWIRAKWTNKVQKTKQKRKRKAA